MAVSRMVTPYSFLTKPTAELPWAIFLLYVNTEYGMWSTEKRKSLQSETSPTIFGLLLNSLSLFH